MLTCALRKCHVPVCKKPAITQYFFGLVESFIGPCGQVVYILGLDLTVKIKGAVLLAQSADNAQSK